MDDPNLKLIDTDRLASILGLSVEEVLFLIRVGHLRPHAGADYASYRFNLFDVQYFIDGKNKNILNAISNDLKIPYRRFVFYLVSFWGKRLDEVNKYLKFSGFSEIDNELLLKFYETASSMIVSDNFREQLEKAGHREHPEFDLWISRIGVASMYNDRMRIPLELLKNKNLRLMVETSLSSGMLPENISEVLSQTFNLILSSDDISFWGDYFYKVDDIPEEQFQTIIKKYYSEDSMAQRRLRAQTQFPSAMAVSRFQEYFIVNHGHQWNNLWSIIAGMSFEKIITAIRGGKACDAKIWADLIEQAVEHGAKQSKTSLPVPASDSVPERDVVVGDLRPPSP